jgi:hypothetical protein
MKWQNKNRLHAHAYDRCESNCLSLLFLLLFIYIYSIKQQKLQY